MPPNDRRRETHELVVLADGEVVVPDLIDAFAGQAARCAGQLGGPRLASCRRVKLDASNTDLANSDEATLWSLHEAGLGLWTRRELDVPGDVTWWAVKRELARRLLASRCRLCARDCGADRAAGEVGFCGLADAASWDEPFSLWGEEPELGRPGWAAPMRGCGLRCVFCYRPNWRDARDAASSPTPDAPPAGMTHVHFLGGNPDESLPAIFDWLDAHPDLPPVVWNTHSYVSAEAAAMLVGVVDGVVADLKFGPGPCAGELCGAVDYWEVATARLTQWAAADLTLIVRHVALPGHLACCARPVVEWVESHLGLARLRLLDQYEPWGAAWAQPGLDRRLNEDERAQLARLGAGKR